MTAEQLEELLGNVTQGEWRVAGKESGYIFSDAESVLVAVVGNYPDSEILPYNKERWDADAALIALAPSLARRVIDAEKLAAEVERVSFSDNAIAMLAALTAYREAGK